MKISQPEGGGNGESSEVVNQWLRWRASPAGFASRPLPICCAKASVGCDFRRRRGILLTVRGTASFSRGRGAKDFCDDRDGYGGFGSVQCGHFPGPRIRGVSHAGLTPAKPRSASNSGSVSIQDLFQKVDLESFNKFGRASRPVGVTCVVTTLSPTDSLP